MAAERTHFLEKVEKLSKLVSAIKLWESSRELELRDIESRLENLSISVEKEGCLNAGGKFEWVDSVLVKVFYQRQTFVDLSVERVIFLLPELVRYKYFAGNILARLF